MSHPFISSLFQVLEPADNYALVMEYAENGNLHEYMHQHGRLPEDQARRYFAQLISVLEYLHRDVKIAHRDLKPENILLDRYNNVRLIDFGLSNVFTEDNPQLHTQCGSPTYLAPEIVKGRPYTANADIWSVGVVLYSLVAGHPPFEDDSIPKLFQKIIRSEPEWPSFFTPPLTNLLQKLMCPNPEQRITLEMIKNHPWFSMVEYAVLQERHGLPSGSGGPIDREIIDQMTALGVDCRPLASALLFGELTDLTALYRIFVRERMTEEMKNVMQKMKSLAPKPAAAQGLPRPSPVRPADRRKNAPATPSLAGKSGIGHVLPAPMVGRVAVRRLSKPVVGPGHASEVANPAPGARETP
jgi:serine/threonine protein kinase